jgi:hypothetical protein
MSSKIKLIAAVSVVLVTLSGFAPARSGGRGGSSDGGGCSSSSSGSHNSSDSYDSDYDSGTSSGSDYDSGSTSGSSYDGSSTTSTGSSSTGTSSSGSTTGGSYGKKVTKRFNAGSDGYVIVRITRCAGASPGSDVELESHVRGDQFAPTYRVRIKYTDQAGNYVDSGDSSVTVGNGETNDTYVSMNDVGRLDEVAACEIESLTEES